MPLPVLVTTPAPLGAALLLIRVPAKVVFSLLPPTVRVCTPRMTAAPVVPPPEREPMVLSKPLRSKASVATLPMVRAEPLPKALVLPALRVPVFTRVGPVYELAPSSLRTPFATAVVVIPPLPVILP